MNLKKYIYAYVLGCLAALSIGKLVMLTGAVTTIDAWFLTLTVVGQDVGDRMVMFAQVLLQESSSEALVGVSYLVGHSILEEIVKFIAFYIAFRITKPTSIREIVFMGMVVGLGFATVESFAFYSAAAFHVLLGFIIRAIGHGLFSGVITLLFGMGYFSQMRWIDSGARESLTSWLVHYQERILQFLWTFFGLVSSAVLHSLVNIFAALGGQSAAILIMMIGWIIFIFFLLRPSAGKPYGTIIREVDLLRQIVEAEHDLEAIEKSGSARKIPNVIEEKKIRKLLKQFAKT